MIIQVNCQNFDLIIVPLSLSLQIDLLTEIEVIEKINCESMLTNIRAQFSIITTNDNSTAQPNQTL